MEGKISVLIQILEKEYPDTKTALHFSTPFQLLIATILSAQTTDTQVNRITPALFKKYRGPEDFVRRSEEEIMEDIKSVNFYRNKARNIKKLCEVLVTQYAGKVPDTMEELVNLPGVARKTANVVLSQAFGKAEGIVVDTHVRRVSQRLGLSSHEEPEKIENDLMKIVPKNFWISFPFMLINHGRKVCKAKNPECGSCAVNKLCAYYSREK